MLNFGNSDAGLSDLISVHWFYVRKNRNVSRQENKKIGPLKPIEYAKLSLLPCIIRII